jgi:hypothetical protein
LGGVDAPLFGADDAPETLLDDEPADVDALPESEDPPDEPDEPEPEDPEELELAPEPGAAGSELPPERESVR